MKYNTCFHTGIKVAISAASIVFTLPSMAIENPIAETSLPQNTPQLKEEGKGVLKGKKIAVLGVGGSPVSASMASQLGIAPGEGMIITQVDPDSAAARMGIQVHDVITELDGQKITDQESLRKAVLSRKPGDQVAVEYIHKSQRREGNAQLGARLVMFDADMEPEAAPQAQSRGLGNYPHADRQLIQQQMDNRMKQLKQQLKGNAGMEISLHKILEAVRGIDQKGQGASQGIHDMIGKIKGLPRAKNSQPSDSEGGIQFSSSSSITHRDGQGAVTMKTVNGLKEIIVKDPAGNIIHEGPYQTDQDKEAVPDSIRQRLDDMNLSSSEDSSYRFRIKGGNR